MSVIDWYVGTNTRTDPNVDPEKWSTGTRSEHKFCVSTDSLTLLWIPSRCVTVNYFRITTTTTATVFTATVLSGTITKGRQETTRGTELQL